MNFFKFFLGSCGRQESIVCIAGIGDGNGDGENSASCTAEDGTPITGDINSPTACNEFQVNLKKRQIFLHFF